MRSRLSIDMADSASSAEDSLDDRNLSCTCTASYWTQEAPKRRQRLGLNVYSYQTQEAPRRRQRLGPYVYSYWTQEAQLKPDTVGRKIGSRTTYFDTFFSYFFVIYIMHVPFHTHHQLTERIFTPFAYPFFVIIYSSCSSINCCMIKVRGMCLRIAYA